MRLLAPSSSPTLERFVRELDAQSADVPMGLRPYVRFSKLPPKALAAARAALDADDGFRGQVAAASGFRVPRTLSGRFCLTSAIGASTRF